MIKNTSVSCYASVYIHTVCAIPPGSYNLRQKSMLKVKKVVAF